MRLRVTDALGRELSFAGPPQRVVSLVPSDTYSIVALGAVERLVGRTAFCDSAEVAALPTVGGTKSINVAAVLALQPDLVIANQEENSRAALEALAAQTKVYVSLPRTFEDGVAHLAKLARILFCNSHACKDLLAQGVEFYRDVPAKIAAAFFPIWQDPWMTCNADTFGSDVLRLAGIENCFGDRLRLYPLAADMGKTDAVLAGERDVRYPRVTLAEVASRRPTMLIMPDEPATWHDADRDALRAAVPAAKMVDVCGKDLFWHGAWAIRHLPRLRAQLAEA
jgi:ABC-type Fe3+-citrate transport system substrate-binding protein